MASLETVGWFGLLLFSLPSGFLLLAIYPTLDRLMLPAATWLTSLCSSGKHCPGQRTWLGWLLEQPWLTAPRGENSFNPLGGSQQVRGTQWKRIQQPRWQNWREDQLPKRRVARERHSSPRIGEIIRSTHSPKTCRQEAPIATPGPCTSDI